MPDHTCKNCRFFELVKRGEANSYGFCRRNAPKVYEKTSAEPPKAQWPVVNAELDWCGEFQIW